MSSQTVKKKAQIFLIYDTDLENSINYDKIIIPFSELGKSESSSYIYDGNEELTFKERHPAYQKLLLDEFID